MRAHFDCPLLGGDTVSTPGPLTISITAFGRVPAGTMVRRSGAKPGDRVVVTGTIGDAALGLDILKGGAVARAGGRPCGNRGADRALSGAAAAQALALAVRDHASAAMDVSDGLAGDLAKLCAASGVSAVIDAASDPAVGGCRRRCWRAAPSASRAIVSGGDDYEILCTIPENCFEAFAQAARRCRCRRDLDRHGDCRDGGSEVS